MKAANQSYSIWAVACAHPFYPVAAENAQANRYIFPTGQSAKRSQVLNSPDFLLIVAGGYCCSLWLVAAAGVASPKWFQPTCRLLVHCHPKIIWERRSGPLGGTQRRRAPLSRSLPSCSVARLRLSAGSRAKEENVNVLNWVLLPVYGNKKNVYSIEILSWNTTYSLNNYLAVLSNEIIIFSFDNGSNSPTSLYYILRRSSKSKNINEKPIL